MELVAEDEFVSPEHAHLMYLNGEGQLRRAFDAAAAAMAPADPKVAPAGGWRKVDLGRVLPGVGRLMAEPLEACGPSRCHHAGWCGRWGGGWGRGRAGTCFCLSEWESDSHELRRLKGDWRGPSSGSVREGRSASRPTAGGRASTWARSAPAHGRRRRTSSSRGTIASRRSWGSTRGARASRRSRGPSCAPTSPRRRRRLQHYGYCHCDGGYWGLDCGMSVQRVNRLLTRTTKPRIYMYEVPVALRRSCGPWRLSEELGDALLASDNLEPDPSKADYFWLYGCPNGDTIMPMLGWIKQHLPHWNASVRAGVPRHVLAIGHEEGWSEVWACWAVGCRARASTTPTWPTRGTTSTRRAPRGSSSRCSSRASRTTSSRARAAAASPTARRAASASSRRRTS